MNRIGAFAFDHRRPLAAGVAALAVLAAVDAAQPSVTTVAVLVADRDLESGRVIERGDLRTVEVPPDARPTSVLSTEKAVGRRVAAPMREGEVVTDRRVIDPRDLSGHGPDAALSMVRLADPTSLAGVRVGDRVDVVASVPGEKAQVVARGATLTVLPRSVEGDTASVGLVTSADDSLALASAGLDAQLTLLVTE